VADLEATKTGPANVTVGDTITYTVQVVNLGPTEHDQLAAVKVEGMAGSVLPELATAMLR